MPPRNQAALDFLLTRRSVPAKTMTGPAPSRDELETILTAAARTPDHGKLEPWRFIVLDGAALTRLGALVETRGAALGVDPDRIMKNAAQFNDAGLCVAVVASPVPSEKIPEIEQLYSAGAVCLAMLNAALAAGWGANWLSGWASHDRDFLDRVATTTIAMEGQGRAIVYAGGWSDYQEQRKADQSLELAKTVEKPKSEKAPKANNTSPKSAGLAFTEKHRLEALPAEIERLEAEIAKLSELLSDPELFTKEPVKFKKATEMLAERQEKLSYAEEEWLLLEEKAEG